MGNRSKGRAAHRQRSRPAETSANQWGPGQEPRDPSDEVRALIGAAIEDLSWERLARFDDHVVLIAARCGEPGPRAMVVGTLTDVLGQRLTQAWEGGWQPADLHRAALRRSTKAVGDFLMHQIRHDLSRFARDTVHPSWWSQLDELLPGSAHLKDPINAGRAAGMSWLSVIDVAVRSIHLLAVLPRIQRITPLPGTWVRTTAAATSEVDERILARVRMLLAKAKSTTFEAEAETFTAGAAALIVRHRIDEALLAETDQQAARDGAQARRIGIDNPYEQPKVQLLGAVAHANSCRAVWSKELGFATVIGFPSDLDGVELLFTSLLVQATRTMTATGQRSVQGAHRRSRTFRSSFLTSFAMRIGERLRQTTAQEEERVGAERGAATGSRLPALIEREQHVKETLTELFPQTVPTRSRATYDAEGWRQGRQAADVANMDVRTKLAGPR